MEKEFKVSKEFIKAGYRAACDEWKKKIKREFPKAFAVLPEDMVVGAWYTVSSKPRSCLRYLGEGTGEGVWSQDVYTSGFGMATRSAMHEWFEAPESRIKEVLIQEAKSRGFTKGSRWYSAIEPEVSIKEALRGTSWAYKNYGGHKDTLYFDGNSVYYKGNWAELLPDKVDAIPTYSKEEAEKLLNAKIKC